MAQRTQAVNSSTHAVGTQGRVVTPPCTCPAESWKTSRWKICLRNGLFVYLISFTSVQMFRVRNSPRKPPQGFQQPGLQHARDSLCVQGRVCSCGPSKTHPWVSWEQPQPQQSGIKMIQLRSGLIFLCKQPKFLVSHTQLLPAVLPFAHRQRGWETANLLRFIQPEH